jgi:hypothetical protein
MLWMICNKTNVSLLRVVGLSKSDKTGGVERLDEALFKDFWPFENHIFASTGGCRISDSRYHEVVVFSILVLVARI